MLLGSIFCYLIGEYAVFPMKPVPLIERQTFVTVLIRIGITAAAHLAVLYFVYDLWGLILSAVLVFFHTIVDLLMRPIFRSVKGKRMAMTLLDLTLHIISMFATCFLISTVYIGSITQLSANFLRFGTAAAIGILLYPVLAKTLLVDAFPRYYSERPLFTTGEWLLDAVYGLASALCGTLLSWWIAALLILAFTAVFFLLSSRMHSGRPVLVLSKIGILVILVPCFITVFKI